MALVLSVLTRLTEDQHQSVGPQLNTFQRAWSIWVEIVKGRDPTQLRSNNVLAPQLVVRPLGSLDSSCQFQVAISVQSSSERSLATRTRKTAFREKLHGQRGVV